MNSRTSLVGLCVLVVAVVVSAFVFFATHSHGAEIAPASSTELAAALPQETGTATSSVATSTEQVRAGYLEYKNERYHISLSYPNDLQFGFTDEGAGAGTITFQDADAAQGFQLFVVPYTGNRMFDDRFARDVPSGVRTDVTNVTVASMPATEFFSTDASLGETRELWFTHKGLLYEVVTFKSLDGWLWQSVQTWKFI